MITKELARIQQGLKVPKAQYNSFAKYNYRNCEDILEAVKPILGDCALTLTDSIEVCGDRIYVKATASLLLEDQAITVDGFAREQSDKKGMDSAQITGAASSYARKYALCGLFAIDDSKDADSLNTDGSTGKATTTAKPLTLTPQQQKELTDYPQSKSVTPEQYMTVTRNRKAAQILQSEFAEIKESLNNLAAQNAKDN